MPNVLAREAVASARSQPAASLLTVIMVAGMCVAALLTTGRTVAAEDAVLSELDEAGTRSVLVRANEKAGVTTAIVGQLQHVSAIESVTGFGPITDARNSRVPDGPPVPARQAYGRLGETAWAGLAQDGMAKASAVAAERLGLVDDTGGIVTTDGVEYTVNELIDVPEHIAFLEPLVLIPPADNGSADRDESGAPVTLLVVQADRPEHVAIVTDVVTGLLSGADSANVKVETSQQLADVRAAIEGELGSYGRSTVLVILAIAAVLVAVNLFGLVTLRRKDFGRRRALGATQPLIVTLLLAQVVILAGIGAVAGTAGAFGWLVLNNQPIPAPDFCLAVAVAAVVTATVAALTPAVVAARRDSLHELRVP